MKKIFRSVLVLALCCALLLPAFSACSSGFETKPFLEYGSQSMTGAVFQYLCCLEKTNYLYEIYGKDSSSTSASALTDNPSFWVMQDENGTTVGEALKSGVLQNVKVMLYLAQYAVDAGYSLTDSDKAKMKANLDQLASNFHTKKEFNRAIAQYGVNYNLLYDYYLLQGQASIGNYLLFGENGKYTVNDDRTREYYVNNYTTIQAIYINNVNKTYANGKTVYMPDEEKAQKTALAEEVYRKLLAGESASELARAYSERSTETTLEKGYTFKAGGFGVTQVEEAAKGLKIGESAKVETASGIYLIQRLALNMDMLTNEKDSISEELENADKLRLVNSVASQFTLNEDFYASIDVAALTHVQ